VLLENALNSWLFSAQIQHNPLNMKTSILLYLLLLSYHFSQGQALYEKIDVLKLTSLIAADSTAYHWVVIWVPSCPSAATDFAQYISLAEKYKLQLHIIAVVVDTTVFEHLKISRLNQKYFAKNCSLL
jgi:hypothetical protein